MVCHCLSKGICVTVMMNLTKGPDQMRINWIELRNKKNGMTLKKTEFGMVNCLESDSPEAVQFIFEAILGASQFAQGETAHGFLDVICRIDFNANHREYLWYAKNTAGENGETIVDEEELYDADNQMLMQRSFKELAYAGYGELPFINLNKSMLHLFNTSEAPSQISAALGHVVYYRPQDGQIAQVLAEITTLPHGTLVLLDGQLFAEPLDITTVSTERNDVQIIAFNCIAADAAVLQVTIKGKMISCK